MANITLMWELPAVSSAQLPIDRTDISFRVAGATEWTFQDSVSPNAVQELVFVDMPPGDFEFLAVIYDSAGNAGPDATTNADVPFAPPGAVVNLTAVVG